MTFIRDYYWYGYPARTITVRPMTGDPVLDQNRQWTENSAGQG